LEGCEWILELESWSFAIHEIDQVLREAGSHHVFDLVAVGRVKDAKVVLVHTTFVIAAGIGKITGPVGKKQDCDEDQDGVHVFFCLP
jgi:hypothetical protein